MSATEFRCQFSAPASHVPTVLTHSSETRSLVSEAPLRLATSPLQLLRGARLCQGQSESPCQPLGAGFGGWQTTILCRIGHVANELVAAMGLLT